MKRDAPAAGKDVNYLEDLQKQFGEFSKQVNDKLKETFNPDELKKGFSDAINNLNKAVRLFIGHVCSIRGLKVFARTFEAIKWCVRSSRLLNP